jgi:hypothetical protein
VEVACRLTQEDFCQTVTVGRMEFDEYGVLLGEAVLETFGLEGKRT